MSFDDKTLNKLCTEGMCFFIIDTACDKPTGNIRPSHEKLKAISLSLEKDIPTRL
jgi:hypothetical protein